MSSNGHVRTLFRFPRSTSSSTSSTTSASTSLTTLSPNSTSEKRGPISPVVSKSKKPKLDDDNYTTIEIEKFLECGVCLDFPASPIHSCDNAHILCGQCAPKFRACPTCQNKKLRRNSVCEKLAKEAQKKIKCVNFEAGCKEDLLSTKFADHLPLCYFREITCNYNVNECGMKVRFHEYTKHLEDGHNQKSDNGPKFTKLFSHDEKQFAKLGALNGIQWNRLVIKFKGNAFIFQAIISKQSQLFFALVSVLGDKDLANKFTCQVRFQNVKSNKDVCSWTLQVLAFHEIPTKLTDDKLFELTEESAALALPMGAIRKWGTLGNDQVLGFRVTYEITEA